MKKQKRTKKAFSWEKEKKALKNGGYSVVLTIIVLAAVIMANKIVSGLPTKYTQFDISTGKMYTIGDETKNILKNLDQDITIYLIAQNKNEDENIVKLLNLYKDESKHIKVEQKDPIMYPSFTKNYTEDEIAENSLIVVCGERNKIVTYGNIYETSIDYSTYQQTVTGFDGEGQVTSAINYVTSGNLPKVYCLEGHGEVELPTDLESRIEKANLEVNSLSLLTVDAVPEDACALMLNAPANDYSAEETEKIIQYLDQGGRAIILSDFVDKDMTNFNSILAHYGVATVKGVVVETDQNHYIQKPYYLVPQIEYSNVTDGMLNNSAYVLISGCQGFQVAEANEENTDAATVSQFLVTSDKAIIKKNPQAMTTYALEDGDEEGKYAVGVTVSKSVASDATEEKTEETTDASDSATQNAGEETRLVAFASSTLLESSLNDTVADGNYTIYMNAMNWLADVSDTSAISIPSKSMEKNMLTITAAKGMATSIIICFILPISCLIAGGIICIRRRKL